MSDSKKRFSNRHQDEDKVDHRKSAARRHTLINKTCEDYIDYDEEAFEPHFAAEVEYLLRK